MKLQLVAAQGIFFFAASKLRLVTLLASALIAIAPSFAQDAPAPQTPAAAGPAEPVLEVEAGPCMAEFVVRDTSGNGVYDAKITLQAQYGFLGLRRLDLSVGTNAEGKARIQGLPEKTRRPADFKIVQGGREKTVAFDPVGRCYAQHDVTLGETTENRAN